MKVSLFGHVHNLLNSRTINRWKHTQTMNSPLVFWTRWVLHSAQRTADTHSVSSSASPGNVWTDCSESGSVSWSLHPNTHTNLQQLCFCGRFFFLWPFKCLDTPTSEIFILWFTTTEFVNSFSIMAAGDKSVSTLNTVTAVMFYWCSHFHFENEDLSGWFSAASCAIYVAVYLCFWTYSSEGNNTNTTLG